MVEVHANMPRFAILVNTWPAVGTIHSNCNKQLRFLRLTRIIRSHSQNSPWVLILLTLNLSSFF